MNRKHLYIFCTAGLLLVALVAAMLLNNTGNGTSTAGKTTVGTAATTEETEQSSVTQDQNSTEQMQPVVGTQTTPTFVVEFGVGGALTFDEETEIPDAHDPTVTVPLATSQATTDQDTEGTEATQSPNTEDSNMTGESTVTAPPATTRPTKDQDTEATGATQSPNTEDSNMTGESTVTVPPATTLPTTDQNTEGKETTQPSKAENSGMPSKLLTYEEFLALTSAEQQAYFFLFEDPLDYASWMQKAQQEYEDGQTSIIVTGPVDLSTLPMDGNEE